MTSPLMIAVAFTTDGRLLPNTVGFSGKLSTLVVLAPWSCADAEPASPKAIPTAPNDASDIALVLPALVLIIATPTLEFLAIQSFISGRVTNIR